MRIAVPLGFILLFSSAADVWALSVSGVEISLDGTILTTRDLETLVNAARCACDEKVEVEIGFSGRGSAGEVALVAGTRCIDSDGALDEEACPVLERWQEDELDATETVSVSLNALAGGTCAAQDESEKLQIVFDPEDDGEWTSLAEVDYRIDTEPPEAPSGESVNPGEGIMEVVYSVDDEEADARYQVLCSRGNKAVFDDPPDAAFDSEADRCGSAMTQGPRAAFVCAEAVDGPSSVTVEGLENGVKYVFEVVAIDPAGNPSAIERVGEGTPAPEEDLWERYRRSGGAADGGHCFVATAAYGDYGHPTVRWLRVFRDEILAASAGGRRFVAMYYAHSPAAAARIGESTLAREAARRLVGDLAYLAIAMLVEGERR